MAMVIVVETRNHEATGNNNGCQQHLYSPHESLGYALWQQPHRRYLRFWSF